MPSFTVPVETQDQANGLNLSQAEKALAERNDWLKGILEQAGDDYDPTKVTSEEFKDGHALAAAVKNANAEITWIGQRVSEFDEMKAIKAETDRRAKLIEEGKLPASAQFTPEGGGAKADDDYMSLAEALEESGALKHAAERGAPMTFRAEKGGGGRFIQEKTAFTTAAGWAPESLRIGRVVMDAQRPIEITDVLPSFPTTQAAIVYMEETTFTNNAAERAENAAYAESALALTERSSTVRSVGTSLPVTDEQLADVAGVRAYLDGRLGFMVRQRLDSQILNGDGIAPNLDGTLNVSNTQTQAKGTDPVPDAIYKGIVLVRVTGRSEPNVVIVHPNDWQDVRLLKTADGIYIWGSPSEAGPERIWGLPVVQSSAVTENTAIVGAYSTQAGLHIRQGLDIQTGYVNDDFLDGRVTIRAGVRAALVHYRPEGFCLVTGI